MFAFCMSCGLVWKGPLDIRPGGKARAILKNVSTKCPRCGSIVQLDGEYEFDANGIETMISSTTITRELYEKIQALYVKAKGGNYDVQAALKEIQSINPKWNISQYLPKNFQDVLLLLTFILGVLQYMKDDKPQIAVKHNSGNVTNVTNIYNASTEGLQNVKPGKQNADRKKYKPRAHTKKKRRQ